MNASQAIAGVVGPDVILMVFEIVLRIREHSVDLLAREEGASAMFRACQRMLQIISECRQKIVAESEITSYVCYNYTTTSVRTSTSVVDVV